MTNFHSEKPRRNGLRGWQPAKIPKRGQSRRAFHAFMLIPGLSGSFYGITLNRSKSSVWAYRAAALKAAHLDPTIFDDVAQLVSEIRPEDGLRMARVRGRAQLPSWSKLAICEYQKRGYSCPDIAAAFCCSKSTVANVLQGRRSTFDLFSGARRLTPAQEKPPGKWIGSIC